MNEEYEKITDLKDMLSKSVARYANKTLYKLGNDVLVIDRDEEKIQEICDYVTHAVQLDATDEKALKSLGIKNFDVAIVSIGSDIQASIMITLLMKELGVKYTIAKAKSDLHSKVLYKIGADKVVLPEKDMGVRIARNLVYSNVLDYIELSPNHSIMEIESSEIWHGKTLKDINFRNKYGVNVVAVKQENDIQVSPGAEYMITPKDIIVAIGTNEQLENIQKKIKK